MFGACVRDAEKADAERHIAGALDALEEESNKTRCTVCGNRLHVSTVTNESGDPMADPLFIEHRCVKCGHTELSPCG